MYFSFRVEKGSCMSKEGLIEAFYQEELGSFEKYGLFIGEPIFAVKSEIRNATIQLVEWSCENIFRKGIFPWVLQSSLKQQTENIEKILKNDQSQKLKLETQYGPLWQDKKRTIGFYRGLSSSLPYVASSLTALKMIEREMDELIEPTIVRSARRGQHQTSH